MRLIRNSLISIFLCEQHHHFPNNPGLNPCRHQWLMSFIKDTRHYCGIKEKQADFFLPMSGIIYFLYLVSQQACLFTCHGNVSCIYPILCFHGNHCCLNSHELVTSYQSILTLMCFRNTKLLCWCAQFVIN